MSDTEKQRKEYFEYQTDEDFMISQCVYCKHKGKGAFCNAFTKIPMNILLNEVDHRQPIEGDNDIQFELNDNVPMSKVDRLFK